MTAALVTRFFSSRSSLFSGTLLCAALWLSPSGAQAGEDCHCKKDKGCHCEGKCECKKDSCDCKDGKCDCEGCKKGADGKPCEHCHGKKK